MSGEIPLPQQDLADEDARVPARGGQRALREDYVDAVGLIEAEAALISSVRGRFPWIFT